MIMHTWGKTDILKKFFQLIFHDQTTDSAATGWLDDLGLSGIVNADFTTGSLRPGQFITRVRQATARDCERHENEQQGQDKQAR